MYIVDLLENGGTVIMRIEIDDYELVDQASIAAPIWLNWDSKKDPK